jgi:hypothetical protein
MWQDEILEEIYQIREEHAKALNYDIKALCADWRKRQAQSGRKVITLSGQNYSHPLGEQMPSKSKMV